MSPTSNKKLALDTNILVYLLNKKSSFYESARLAVLATEKQKIQLVVCQQSLVELIKVLTDYYQYKLIQAANQVKKLLATNIQVIAPLSST
ncbi:MAG: PIN domain-containing protein, partial [Patescibacteria group bacterium]|nr:PIN domain-containing protein [Patescibacteria group bacterium]